MMPGTPAPSTARPAVHSAALRDEFPQLAAGGGVYLDSAATSLKPRRVIERLTAHLSSSVANVHRGAHAASIAASEAFEAARAGIARSLGAAAHEVVFTAGTSWSLQLVAELLRGRCRRALVTRFEHHSNLLPWQARFELATIPCSPTGRIDTDAAILRSLAPGDVVSVAHASNVTGVVQPVERLAAICRRAGAILVIDGAQSYPHLPIDVEALGCDFFAASAHKALGPSGVGILYGARRWLDRLEPAWLGGGTVDKYSLDEGHGLRPVPHRFELGTPNIEGILAAAVAAEMIDGLDRREIAAQADALYRRMAARLAGCGAYRVLGGLDDEPYISVLTFSTDRVPAHDLAVLLADRHGIGVRAGYHCAHPLYTHLGVAGGVRLSPYVYNTVAECDGVVDVLVELAEGGGRRAC